MSPSEDDLRAALRDGEGPTLDPDAVLALSRAHSAGRRSTLWVAASGTLVAAAAVAVGVVALNGSSGPSPVAGSAGRSDFGSQAYGPIPPGAGGTSGGRPDSSAVAGGRSGSNGPAAAVCPATYPGGHGGVTTLPGTGDERALLPADAEPVTVCGYDGGQVRSLVLTGAQASALSSSVNTAPTSKPAQVCPMYRVADPLDLVIIAGGRQVWTSVGNPACSTTVTDGTSTRYDWAPPASVAARIDALR